MLDAGKFGNTLRLLIETLSLLGGEVTRMTTSPVVVQSGLVEYAKSSLNGLPAMTVFVWACAVLIESRRIAKIANERIRALQLTKNGHVIRVLATYSQSRFGVEGVAKNVRGADLFDAPQRRFGLTMRALG
jgi:hypothetical protein